MVQFVTMQGYGIDGEVVCPDCLTNEEKVDEVNLSGYLEGQNDLEPGSSCGRCGRWFTPDNDWVTHEESPVDDWRWATCRIRNGWQWVIEGFNYYERLVYGCNHQQPFYFKGYWHREDVHTRYDALRGQLRCECCHKAMHF